MKKALKFIGIIIVAIYFIGNVLPNLIGVPLAAFHSYNSWKMMEGEKIEISTPESVHDSIGDFPFPIGSVSDFEKVFNEKQILELSKIIRDYEEQTTREIAIVTINSIEPYENIKDYSTDLANAWGIGKSETNNGLIILFSKNLREIRISTGIGTEKILTDDICKKVIDQTIIPEFKKGDYYSGIEKGMIELIKKWNQ